MRSYAAFHVLLTTSILAALPTIAYPDDCGTNLQAPTGNIALAVDEGRRSPDPITELAQRLASDPLWENGANPVVDLHASATTDEILKSLFSKISFGNKGHIKHYKAGQARKVKIVGSEYKGCLVATDLGQKIVLYRLLPAGSTWWCRVFDVDAISTAPNSSTVGPDAIDRLADTLRSDGGLWLNGRQQPIRLPASAQPEEIVAEAVKKSFPPGTITTLHLVTHRTIDAMAPPVSKVSAALVETNSGTKILIYYFLGDGLGWWHQFYEAPPATALMQASAEEVAALDRLVKKLTEQTIGVGNGRRDSAALPADASAEAVLEAAIRVDAPIRAINPPYGAITSHKIKLIRKITPKYLTGGPFPTQGPWYAAIVGTNLGTKILVFQYSGKEWFTRFYDSDEQAPTGPSHASL